MKRTCLGKYITIVSCCFLLSGCHDKVDRFIVRNVANYPVKILSQKFDNLEDVYSPEHFRHPGSSRQIAFPGGSVWILSQNEWEKEVVRQDGGFIKIYIMDTLPHGDTLCIYYMQEWSIRKSNNIIAFPPTEDMRDFKMWPPYGTYDVYGNRVD